MTQAERLKKRVEELSIKAIIAEKQATEAKAQQHRLEGAVQALQEEAEAAQRCEAEEADIHENLPESD